MLFNFSQFSTLTQSISVVFFSVLPVRTYVLLFKIDIPFQFLVTLCKMVAYLLACSSKLDKGQPRLLLLIKPPLLQKVSSFRSPVSNDLLPILPRRTDLFAQKETSRKMNGYFPKKFRFQPSLSGQVCSTLQKQNGEIT